ncbi:MAG: succinate-semialdehyde dehydrogenase [Desulfuromonas sp. SDB]|nr:MAG: succinate-semialdehyde dehydrogenase [Desulfuromonas sp. SDB]
MTIKAINPANKQIINHYQQLTDQQAEQHLIKSNQQWKKWKDTDFRTRSELMIKAAGVLQAKTDKYAQLITEEMGKPITSSRAEVDKCAWVCRYYAQHAQDMLKTEPVSTDAFRSMVTYQPLGLILGIMPWNFPFWQVFRFAVPTLIAGNGVLVKHASNVPGCSEAIEEIFNSAGFPPDIYKNLLLSSSQALNIISHPLIKGVSLTGSTEAGKSVAKAAGANLKKTVLELGGNDPYVILSDADLSAAVETCVTSKLINSGQSCIAAKRFIVVKELREEFEKIMVKKMNQAIMGDPRDDKTQVGPLAREDLVKLLDQQVRDSINQGAICLLGGKISSSPGFYYPPTVLTEVKPGMPAYNQELFGPVASIIIAGNDQEAVEIANDSSFGLGAAVFTQNISKGEQIAILQLEAGSCFVNSLVKSDPRLPFGGIKQSGYGRELSRQGILEFVNIKTVYVK